MRTKGEIKSMPDPLFADTSMIVTVKRRRNIELAGDNLDHLVACWNAIESLGGDPARIAAQYKVLRTALTDQLDLHRDMMNRIPHGTINWTSDDIMAMNEIPGRSQHILDMSKEPSS